MADQDYIELVMTLMLGPHLGGGVWSENQLRRGWKAYRSRLEGGPSRPGSRCWAWWRFEQDSEPPDGDAAQALRLLELGEVADEERAGLRVRAREAVEAADWADHLDATGSIVTSPASARETMRERRERDRLAWGQVLEALAA